VWQANKDVSSVDPTVQRSRTAKPKLFSWRLVIRVNYPSAFQRNDPIDHQSSRCKKVGQARRCRRAQRETVQHENSKDEHNHPRKISHGTAKSNQPHSQHHASSLVSASSAVVRSASRYRRTVGKCVCVQSSCHDDDDGGQQWPFRLPSSCVSSLEPPAVFYGGAERFVSFSCVKRALRAQNLLTWHHHYS